MLRNKPDKPSEKSIAYQHQAVSLLARGFSSISLVILVGGEVTRGSVFCP